MIPGTVRRVCSLPGHLTRYPGVRLVLSHGGGPRQGAGCLRRSFATAPADNSDPAEGFRKLYFDTVVYDSATLRFVREVAGPGRILMGTDQPFAIGEDEPVKFSSISRLQRRYMRRYCRRDRPWFHVA